MNWGEGFHSQRVSAHYLLVLKTDLRKYNIATSIGGNRRYQSERPIGTARQSSW